VFGTHDLWLFVLSGLTDSRRGSIGASGACLYSSGSDFALAHER
jgi:hypothetical protein